MGITGPTKTEQTLIDFKHAVLTGKPQTCFRGLEKEERPWGRGWRFFRAS